MKKTLSLLVVTVLMLSLLSVTAFAQGAIIFDGEAADGVTSSNVDNSPAQPATVIDTSGNVISNAGAAAAVVGDGRVAVTKSPTSETVEKGGKATFVAHAANSSGITWRLVSADGMETINVAAVGQYFKGVETWGLGTDSLTIKNIPDNMNGWMVEAKFDGPSGPVYSAGARITVVGSTANGTTNDVNTTGRIVAGVGGNGTAPTITEQPVGAELSSGKSTTLSVTAGTGDGGALHYQWYISTSDSNQAGQAIAGATSASYTPGELQGTRYYYAGVWSEKDGVKSDTVYSNTAAVVYSGAAASPSPAPSAAPANEGGNTGTDTNTNNTNTGTNTGSNTAGNTGVQPAATEAPGMEIVPDPNDPDAQQTGTDGQVTVAPTDDPTRTETEPHSSLPVILGAIAAVALAAGVGLLVLRRNAGQ